MPDPNATSIASDRRSFSAPPAEVAGRSAMASSLNLADSGETTATNQPTFHDLLDAVNPLQHLPVVSWIYRAVTGDQISPQARIVGDALYGGVTGLVSGMFNALLEKNTGKDVGAQITAMFESKPAGQPATNIAAATATGAAAAPTASAVPSASAPAQPTTAAAAPTPSAAAVPATGIAAMSSASAPAQPTTAAGATPTASVANNAPAPPGQAPQAAQPLSADSQAALASLAADLHNSSPSSVTPAAILGGRAAAPATTANGMPLPAKPVLAARAGGNSGSPSGLGLADYWRRPVSPATTVPLPSPPVGGVGSSQAAANYAQALELSKQLQSYYQSPDPAKVVAPAAPSPADIAAP